MGVPELTIVPQETEPLAPEGWQVTDIASLDWALSRVADLELEVEQNNELAAAAIARIKLKTDILNERAEKGAAFFRSVVTAYAESHKAELLGGGKKKSRTLLHGTVGWRKTGGRLEVRDAEAALDWARAQPVESGVLRIKEELDKKALNALHEKTGEVPPGCDVSPEAEELTIKAAMGGNNGD